jgi:hypothetical protein
MDVYRHAVAVLQVCPTVDLFAAEHNCKCLEYVVQPRSRQAQAAAVDAFQLPTWKTGLPYAFPPVQLIDRVLERLIREEATAVIVIPKRPSQPWWSLVRRYAVKVVELGVEKEVLIAGPLMKNSPTEKKLPPGLYLMALFCPTTSRGMLP